MLSTDNPTSKFSPSANNSSSQRSQAIISLSSVRPLIAIFTTFSPLSAYRPPTTQLTPTMSPITRLTTLLRALLAHLYIRRSPTPVPTPEERAQFTYDPTEYSCSSGDSIGSDDIPWAEHVCDGSDNAARRGKRKGGG